MDACGDICVSRILSIGICRNGPFIRRWCHERLCIRYCHSRLSVTCVQQVVLTAPTTVYLWHPSKTICPSHGRRCGNISACGLSSSSTRRGSYRLFPQGPPDRIRSTPEGRRISSGHRQSRGLWRCVNDVLPRATAGLDTWGGSLREFHGSPGVLHTTSM
jgi:hypothetical protein